jgi:hypothetical protein
MLRKFLSFPWGRLVCLWATLNCTFMALDRLSTSSIAAAILAVGFLFAFVALYWIAVVRGIKERSD